MVTKAQEKAVLLKVNEAIAPVKPKTNAERFIAAYNSIDYALRTIYNIKRATSFSDAVRRAALNNASVRKFEEELVDYARLRNSIVHAANDKIMAEPHTDVTEKIEHIERVLSMPPLAINTARKGEIVGIDASATIKKTMAKSYEVGFRNLPVFKNGAIIGVSNLTHIADAISEVIFNGKNVGEYIETAKVEEVLKRKSSIEYFVIADQKLTVNEALTLFEANRRLVCILITPKGTNTEKPIGILTTADVIDLNRIIDEY